MKKLFALLVALFALIGAAVVATLFWRKKNQKSRGSMWGSANDTTSSWAESASDEAGKAADKLSGMTENASETASETAEGVKDALGN
jgi:hypothetical protein